MLFMYPMHYVCINFYRKKASKKTKQTNLFTDNAQLEYTCLAFSGDGKKLASLSGVPDFLLTVW